MNLYEKLNRLDDSLVESKRVVKKKKLTESVEDVARRKEFLKSVFTKWEILDLAEAHNDFTGRTYKEAFDYVLNNWDNFYFEDEYEAFCEDEYDDDIDEMLTENRWNPYFTPYGYRDAAKVLNRKAPEYYYHLKEIEMDTGDGVKLARYAMRKGLPVMVDKNSDPDYPEFAIKGEYHWDDYFYPYPTAHEEDLVAWDGKMFVEEQLTESIGDLSYNISRYINSRYDQYNPRTDDTSSSEILVRFSKGVYMNIAEPYDDEFFIQFEEDLNEKFMNECKLHFEMIDTDEILITIEAKLDADNEPYVNYKTGRYAKDLKRPDEGYVVYNNGMYIGHADSPREAEMMITHHRS